jgi:hypothetical protein
MRGSNILIRKETCGLAAWVKWQSICIASIQPRVQPPSTTKKIKNKKRKKKKKNLINHNQLLYFKLDLSSGIV